MRSKFNKSTEQGEKGSNPIKDKVSLTNEMECYETRLTGGYPMDWCMPECLAIAVAVRCHL